MRGRSNKVGQLPPLPSAPLCECEDPACPACGGACEESAVMLLDRIDLCGESTVAACGDCGADMLESGVFAMEDPDDEC